MPNPRDELINFFNFPSVALPLLRQILANQVKQMATQAEVQAAVDGITASVADITAHLSDEDGAIMAILTWVQAHPGTLPDTLVTQLTAAKADMDSAVADITTHTDSLVAGTPAP